MPTLLDLLLGVGALPRWLLAGVKMLPSTMLLPDLLLWLLVALSCLATQLLGSLVWLAILSTVFEI